MPQRRAAGAFLPCLLAGLLVSCATGTALEQDPGPALAARVDALVAPLVAAHEFSGAIVMARHNQIVYRRGFGMADRTAAVPFTADTPADGGSLAKTFTAAGIWWLVHEGRIDIDAPVARYVPEYPHENTTVRHLLAHSNGLPADYGFFDPYFSRDEVWTTTAMLRLLAAHAPQPAFAPGSRYEYSNLGYDTAALVIERVTGQSYATFLKERFFKPLGMESSFARPARLADWQGTRTLGYAWRDGAWKLYDVFDLEGFLGASNLYFSAADLARWGSAHAIGTALPARAFAAGQQYSLIAGQPSPVTGLSWYCDSDKVRCNYTGHLNAFHDFTYWDREREEAVAFVSNSTLPPWKTIRLQRGLVQALAGLPPDPDEPLTLQAFDRTTRLAVAGTYISPGVDAMTVSAGPDGMSLRVGSGLTFPMYPASPEVFYVPGLDYWLAFTGGPRAYDLHVKSLTLDIVARSSGARSPAT